MDNLRHILCLKTITIIALATLFISTMPIRQSQAEEDRRDRDRDREKEVSCPCDFWKATSFAKRQVEEIGGEFDITECEVTANAVEAFGTTGTCRIELEVETEDDNGLVTECEYIFQCPPADCITVGEDIPGQLALEANCFALGFEVDGLSSEQEDACRDDIIKISERVFDQMCEDTLD